MKEVLKVGMEFVFDESVYAQTMTDPVEILKDEHTELLRQLHVMSNAANSIKLNGFSVEGFEQIVNVISYIDKDVRLHTEREERYVFTKLEKYISGPPLVMRNEHRELWRVIALMKQLIKNMEDGKIHGRTVEEMIQTTEYIVEFLTAHVEKENTILFPMVIRLLTAEEYQQCTIEL